MIKRGAARLSRPITGSAWSRHLRKTIRAYNTSLRPAFDKSEVPCTSLLPRPGQLRRPHPASSESQIRREHTCRPRSQKPEARSQKPTSGILQGGSGAGSPHARVRARVAHRTRDENACGMRYARGRHGRAAGARASPSRVGRSGDARRLRAPAPRRAAPRPAPASLPSGAVGSGYRGPSVGPPLGRVSTGHRGSGRVGQRTAALGGVPGTVRARACAPQIVATAAVHARACGGVVCVHEGEGKGKGKGEGECIFGQWTGGGGHPAASMGMFHVDGAITRGAELLRAGITARMGAHLEHEEPKGGRDGDEAGVFVKISQKGALSHACPRGLLVKPIEEK
ncbi:predicted protein [Postia placenta Mad-698-R]|uniref:Uncharacterized protein n=1 Tax=Postia placenta MAD-698-R-SB12 TaxID=670580 RepID=A0A1X6NBV6_9APHY|nr:hypothetical protein POSPLADRAFT_1043458 [Postia placenta MAD-698-R-SB12]EED78255.1 predicted protein [Postia placenta Mad-698-R]OSX65873.1 hypothetical protein POSPLADRAFT_1043458 [Postia placenta MAD-698-R-SB12]